MREPGEDRADPVGLEIDGCRLERLLGRGAMGAVFLGYEEFTDRHVAIKTIRPEFADLRPEAVQRFRTEARAIARIRSEHVVRLHSAGESPDLGLFVKTEYFEGGDLARFLTAEPRPEPRTVAGWMLGAAIGLRDAHRAGVIHRDIKPANLLLREGEVVVADFGIAALEDARTRLTADGSLLGTALYMSPEQCEGKPADERSDAFALGATFFHLLTGKKPAAGDSIAALLNARLNTSRLSLADSWPGERMDPLLRELDRILETLTAREPEQRPRDLSSVVDGLREALARTPPSGDAPTSKVPATAEAPIPRTVASGEPSPPRTGTPHSRTSTGTRRRNSSARSKTRESSTPWRGFAVYALLAGMLAIPAYYAFADGQPASGPGATSRDPSDKSADSSTRESDGGTDHSQASERPAKDSSGTTAPPSDASRAKKPFDPNVDLDPVEWPDSVNQPTRDRIDELLNDFRSGGIQGQRAQRALAETGWPVLFGATAQFIRLDYSDDDDLRFAFELNAWLYRDLLGKTGTVAIIPRTPTSKDEEFLMQGIRFWSSMSKQWRSEEQFENARSRTDK